MNEQKTKKARKIIMMITIVFIAALIIIGGIAVFFADPPETSEPQESGESEGKGEGGNTEKITSKPEDIPFINAALRSYFYLKDGEELTPKMLSEVKSISINHTTYTSQKEGYYLLDVYINGETDRGGAVEIIVEKSRFEDLINELETANAPQLVKKRFEAFFMQKNPANEDLDQVKQQIIKDYPISETTPIYVLTRQIKEREIDELASFMAQYTTFFDDKYIKADEKINGELFSCYPNLEELYIRGVGLENAPKGVKVIASDADIIGFNTIKENDIENITVNNKKESYVLRYDSSNGKYTVNGKSDGYDQKLISDIYDTCVGKFGYNYVVSDDAPGYKLDEASRSSKYTVTLNSGKEYTIFVSGDMKYRAFEGDYYVYSCSEYDFCQLLRTVEELKIDVTLVAFNDIPKNNIDSIYIENKNGSFTLSYNSFNDKYSINGESEKYDQELLETLWNRCVQDVSDIDCGYGVPIDLIKDFGYNGGESVSKYTVKLKDGTQHELAYYEIWSGGENENFRDCYCCIVMRDSKICYRINRNHLFIKGSEYYERDPMKEAFNSKKENDILSVTIHNSKDTYTLTYDATAKEYSINGKSEGYDQSMLSSVWAAALNKLDSVGIKTTDLSEYKLTSTPEQDEMTAKYTVRMTDGTVFEITANDRYMCFAQGYFVYERYFTTWLRLSLNELSVE